jgi:hypothetical protein
MTIFICTYPSWDLNPCNPISLAHQANIPLSASSHDQNRFQPAAVLPPGLPSRFSLAQVLDQRALKADHHMRTCRPRFRVLAQRFRGSVNLRMWVEQDSSLYRRTRMERLSDGDQDRRVKSCSYRSDQDTLGKDSFP